MKALVLAGGFPQIALIKELKRRGIMVVLADYFKDPIAKPYADKFYRVSTMDIVAIEQVAKKESVDFLITACTDQALLTVALVSENLNLPCYIDYQTAKNVTNKSYMKKVFFENSIPTAKYEIVKENETITKTMEYPLIVKPVDCNSSKGVKRVNDSFELRSALEDAVNLSRTKTAIVEEFVEGSEISVDVYVENGNANILCVTNSDKISEKDKFVIFRTRYPAKENSSKIMQLIKNVAQNIAESFGIMNAPMLIQMITDGEKISVLEFSARTGGGLKYRLIKKVSGFDVISAVIDLTLGKKIHFEIKHPENKYICNEFIYCNEGRYDRLDGFEELKEKKIISEYYAFKSRGAETLRASNSGDRVAGFTIQAENPEEMKAKHKAVLENVRVLDVEGRDIMNRSLLTDWYY